MPAIKPLRWRFGAKRFDTASVAFTVDGHDLVHISEIDANGSAFVIVYESSHPDAEVLFSGRINVNAHKEDHAPVQGNRVHQH
jgi:hypothetical protein